MINDVELQNDDLIKRLNATTSQVKKAHNRAIRRSKRSITAKARRIMRDDVEAKDLKVIKTRFYESNEKKAGMLVGRFWIGFNPIPTKNLKGKVEISEDGKTIKFRGKEYPKAFSIPIGPEKKRQAFQRVGGKIKSLAMPIPEETQKRIERLIITEFPKKYRKEFEHDLKVRVEGIV